MADFLLSIEDLVVQYWTPQGYAKAVDHVNLYIKSGEVFGLVGESGSGKSTLGKAILKLLPDSAEVSQGKIFLNGEDLIQLTEKDINKRIRGKEISMVIQNPQNALNPVFKVGTQILDVLYFKSDKKVSRKDLKPEAIEILRKMGISDPEYRFEEYPHQFSGGMKQRVMLAMAFISHPALLIADEPTTALDVTVEAQILDLLQELVAEYGTSILYITHDLGVVSEITDRIAVMYAGKIVEVASTDELFNNPLHPYTSALLGCLPGVQDKEELTTIPGQVPDLNDKPSGCNFCPRCDYCFEKCLEAEPALYAEGNEHFVACYLYDEVEGENNDGVS